MQGSHCQRMVLMEGLDEITTGGLRLLVPMLEWKPWQIHDG